MGTDKTHVSIPDLIDEVGAWVDDNWNLDMPLADWWQRLSDSGLAFPQWPENYGGRGLNAAAAAAVLQALASRGVIGPPTGNAPNMGALTVLAHGTTEQKDRFVSPVASG